MRLYSNSLSLNAVIFLFLFFFSSAGYSYTKPEIIMHFENKEPNTNHRKISPKEMYLRGLIDGVQRYNLMKGMFCSDITPEKIIPKIKKIDAESLFVSVYFALLFESCEDSLKEQNEFFEKKIVPLLN